MLGHRQRVVEKQIKSCLWKSCLHAGPHVAWARALSRAEEDGSRQTPMAPRGAGGPRGDLSGRWLGESSVL